jgi:hypothetical protein
MVNLTNSAQPFYDYLMEDKSKYPLANTIINPRTNDYYIDSDNDFRVGESGGFLLNIEFKFVNTYLLREAALTYERLKSYTLAPRESEEYEEFRIREEHRRRVGFTAPCKLNKDGSISDLSIPGNYYNFLNYGRMIKLDWASVLRGDAPKKIPGFPAFMDSQYWMAKVDNFARLNGFNTLTLKSRRKGVSYIEGIDSANEVNLYPAMTVIHAAYDSKYLTEGNAITVMTQNQLNFYEQNTPFVRGAVKRNTGESSGLLKKTIEHMVLGYKDLNNTDSGFLSRVMTVSTRNNPAAAIGKDASKIKLDELNNFPNLAEFMKETVPTTTTGSFKTGFIKGFGTGGVKENHMLAFISYYQSPHIYDFMPFENVWDFNRRHEICGFYLPYWWGLEGMDEKGNLAMDEHGNSNYDVAVKIFLNERKWKKEGKAGDSNETYEEYISKYSNNPEESLTYSSTSILASDESRRHQERLSLDRELQFYTDGMVLHENGKRAFKSNSYLLANGYKDQANPYIEKVPFSINENIKGCLRMFFPPFKDRITGEIPDNLYFTLYDPIAIEKELTSVTNKNSLASFQIWMYPNNIVPGGGKIMVASFAGRRESNLELDRICIECSRYYNAKILAEMDRGDVKINFKAENAMDLLLPDPIDVMAGKKNPSKGILMGTSSRSFDSMNALKDFLNEIVTEDENGIRRKRVEYILDLPTVREINLFNFKSNFDRISTLKLMVNQMNAYTYFKNKPKQKNVDKVTLAKLLLLNYKN